MANTLRFKRGLVATIPTAVAGEPLFTTDTFDLYIGNGTTNTRFQKYIASGTTSQLLRGDGSLLTMPIVLTSPSNGQVLKYNGTNWVNDSDAGVTGSGTTNYLPKWTSGSALGNSVIFESGNSIGIGTITPQAYTNYSVLEISNTTGGVLRLKNTAATALFEVATNTSETYIKNISNTPMWFGVNNTEGMRLTSTGLGIGTTSPSAKISIVGDSELASFTSSTLGGAYSVFKHFNLGPGGTAWRGNVMGANIKIVSYAPAIDVAGFGASAIVYGSDTNQGFLKFFTTNSTVSGTPLSLSMLLATDASATFYNTVNINAVAWLQFNGANTLLGEGTNTYLQANGSGSIIFRNNTPSELMRLTSGGNLLVGTTTDSGEKLQVNGTMILKGVGYPSISFDSDSSSTTWGLYSASSSNYFAVFNGTIDVLKFATNGDATFSSSVTAGGSIASGLGLIVANATNARRFELGYSTGAGYNFFQVYDGAAFQPMMINNLLYLNGSSNVGIGTPSPAAKLHLVDSVESEIRTQYSTTSSGKLITGNGFTTIGSITNDPLVFVSNNTERMRFTNGGNLLLGSTSDTGEKFQVTGAGIVSGLFTVSGSTGIPATTATYIRFASGFASPDIGRMYIGDGSGWKFHMSKRLSSTTTDLITFFDNGSVQTSAPTGYAAKPYKLGEVLTNAATADRSIVVEIDGTVYFLLASTTAP